MLFFMLKGAADTEPCLLPHGLDQPVLIVLQKTDRQIEHRHMHPAGNVHPDRIGNDRVVRCQHAADRQAIPDMGIRHQGADDRYRQTAGILHLDNGLRIMICTPLAVICRRTALLIRFPAFRKMMQGIGKIGPHRMIKVLLRPVDNGPHPGPNLSFLHP